MITYILCFFYRQLTFYKFDTSIKVVFVCDLFQNRPSTKVHAAPGGNSSIGFLFGDKEK